MDTLDKFFSNFFAVPTTVDWDKNAQDNRERLHATKDTIATLTKLAVQLIELGTNGVSCALEPEVCIKNFVYSLPYRTSNWCARITANTLGWAADHVLSLVDQATSHFFENANIKEKTITGINQLGDAWTQLQPEIPKYIQSLCQQPPRLFDPLKSTIDPLCNQANDLIKKDQFWNLADWLTPMRELTVEEIESNQGYSDFNGSSLIVPSLLLYYTTYKASVNAMGALKSLGHFLTFQKKITTRIDAPIIDSYGRYQGVMPFHNIKTYTQAKLLKEMGACSLFATLWGGLACFTQMSIQHTIIEAKRIPDKVEMITPIITLLGISIPLFLAGLRKIRGASIQARPQEIKTEQLNLPETKEESSSSQIIWNGNQFVLKEDLGE